MLVAVSVVWTAADEGADGAVADGEALTEGDEAPAAVAVAAELDEAPVPTGTFCRYLRKPSISIAVDSVARTENSM